MLEIMDLVLVFSFILDSAVCNFIHNLTTEKVSLRFNINQLTKDEFKNVSLKCKKRIILQSKLI